MVRRGMINKDFRYINIDVHGIDSMETRHTFRVGDIVTVKCNRDDKIHRAFIEEIIRDPYPQKREGTWASYFGKGKYSLYGLDPVVFQIGSSNPSADWYFGDYIEDTITPTGESMSLKDLQEYKNKMVGGFKKDIDKVIKNLGRNSGRNEPFES